MQKKDMYESLFFINFKWDTSVIKNRNPFKSIVDTTVQYKAVQRFQFYRESGVNPDLVSMFFIIYYRL